jgi:hypothetical protein
MLRFPQASEGVKRAYEALDETQRRGVFTETAEIASAISGGRHDLALARLRRRAEAARAAGQEIGLPDQLMISALESGDPDRIRQAGIVADRALATMGGPNNYGGIRNADAPQLRNVGPGDVVMDERTGEVQQSPVPSIIPGQDGSFYQRDPVPGVPTIGGAAPAPAPAPAATAPNPGVATSSSWGVISRPGDSRDGGARRHAGFDMFNENPEWRPAQPFEIRNVRNGPRQGITADVVFPDGTRIVAMHLRERPVAGQYQAGQLAGIAGNTGNARNTPPHIHAEAFDARGNRIDPSPYFGVDGGVRRVRTVQEARALPPGTRFMTPDGRVKVR